MSYVADIRYYATPDGQPWQATHRPLTTDRSELAGLVEADLPSRQARPAIPGQDDFAGRRERGHHSWAGGLPQRRSMAAVIRSTCAARLSAVPGVLS